MQGTFAHDTVRYRCRYPSEYALVNELDHPLTAYVREAAIVPKLDAWIAGLFDQTNLDATCEALAQAGESDNANAARAEAARRKLADCDGRLAKYRKALEAGAEPTVVAGWLAEVQRERLGAEADLMAATPRNPVSKDQVRKLVLEARDIALLLAEADPESKADLYAELGVQIRYDPFERVISATAGPCTKVRVGGGT